MTIPELMEKFKIGGLYRYIGQSVSDKTVLCLGLKTSVKGVFVGDFLNLETLKIYNADLTHVGKRFTELKDED